MDHVVHLEKYRNITKLGKPFFTDFEIILISNKNEYFVQARIPKKCFLNSNFFQQHLIATLVYSNKTQLGEYHDHKSTGLGPQMC